MNKTVENIFWLLALAYVAIVMFVLIKTAPGFGHHGLAAMPAMTLTLPTSLLFMVVAPKTSGFGVFILITAAAALVNIGLVYSILFGLDRSDKGDR